MGAESLLELRVPAKASELQNLRTQVRDLINRQGCEPEQVNRVVLAVNEACMNVIQHAYGRDDGGDIILEILRDGDEMVFRITDFAEPVDTNNIRSRDLDDIRPGGLGVHLISEVMDATAFVEPPEGAGNTLEMRTTIRCPGSPSKK